MSRTLRFVTGQGSATPGAVGRLAFAIADEARARGLRVIRIAASHNPHSGSRYLELQDGRGFRWMFRISNHRRPQRVNRNQPPHFDLVSIDATAGVGQAVHWLDEIATGRMAWFEPEQAPAIRANRCRR
jgi:hypothetical protein